MGNAISTSRFKVIRVIIQCKKSHCRAVVVAAHLDFECWILPLVIVDSLGTSKQVT